MALQMWCVVATVLSFFRFRITHITNEALWILNNDNMILEMINEDLLECSLSHDLINGLLRVHLHGWVVLLLRHLGLSHRREPRRLPSHPLGKKFFIFFWYIFGAFLYSRVTPVWKCTANTLYRKFETNIPRNETARPRSQFLHSCICERFIYSHDQSAYFAAAK